MSSRIRHDFNGDWRFLKGDADGAAFPVFDDSQWRPLCLPHDWAIEGPFDERYNARCGGLPFHGVGWYRKHFAMPDVAAGQRVTVEFDGAMCHSEVWLNGECLGARPNGYIGFEYDLTPHLVQGDDNLLAVKLSPRDASSRWYPGAGLYRHVWLETKGMVRIGHWGTFVTTPRVTEAAADIDLSLSLVNEHAAPRDVEIETTILDANGIARSVMHSPVSLAPADSTTVVQQQTIKAPVCWSLEHPHLYTAETRVLLDGEEVDCVVTRFGIRSIRYTRAAGFELNGVRTRFQGVCLHHDNGPLGAIANRRAIERKLQILKSMGVNAVRTSHNPPSPELLDLCDELGLLVQVEAFDCWEMPKKGVEQAYNTDFLEWHERDLRDMLHRDRNHPCVVMWSIGNEIMEQDSLDTGARWARALTAICHEVDPTRPVTAGFNIYPACIHSGLAAEVDIVGLNYKPNQYGEVLDAHPDWLILGCETSSCVSSRGVYHLPLEKYGTHPSLQVSSYDFIGPVWSYPPDYEFAYLEKHPEVLGEFVWTGFDYLGEPTPYGGRDHYTNGYWNYHWPARSSYFGAIDLCGFPKDRFYLYQSQWTSAPMLHLLPHWNWEGHEGEEIPVFCYTNCDAVELFLDGVSLGRRIKGVDCAHVPMRYMHLAGENGWASPYRLRWDVPYAPGRLEAIGIREGKEACREHVVTASLPAAVILEPDRSTMTADGDDLCYVAVRIVDANGNPCPCAELEVRFSVTGAGERLAVGNGNAATIEPFQSDRRHTFNGMCLLIVRSIAGREGEIRIAAESDGIERGQCVVRSELTA